MFIKSLSVGLIQTNCYLIGCEDTLQAAVIDPGGHVERILQAAEDAHLNIKYVLNTHAHFDHMAGNADLLEQIDAELGLHPLDLPLLQAGGGADIWGVPLRPSPAPDMELKAGQIIQVGQIELQVLFTPGHSPGHVCFYAAEQGALFDGDVLFQRGIGRTDLPGGDFDILMRSIQEQVLKLPDETIIYPGHGPQTSVGEEKWGNPWLRQATD